MRTIEVSGHLAADAERKMNKNGKEYISFRIGNNEFNDKDEQGNRRTFWFSVTSYNQRHFAMKPYLTKGKPVIVRGEYNDRVGQNQSGACDIWRDIMADSIYFNPFGESKPENQETPQTQTVMQEAPKTQTVMKPTTAELKIPEANTQTNNNDSDDDDLPF